MKIESQSSVSFFSDELNREKYNALLSKAVLIRDFKNKLSSEICINYLDYINISKYDFMKLKNTQINGLTGQEIQLALVDVYTKYQNKFDKINNSIKFRLVDKYEKTYYKRSAGLNKKGDLKEINIKFKSTPLTCVLTYIAKTKFQTKDDVITYIQNRIEKITDETQTSKIQTSKIKSITCLYNEIINKLNSKHSDYIMKLAIQKREQIFKRFQTPIEFKERTYRSLNRLSSQIINKNKNKFSVKEVWLKLGGFDGRKTLDIPVTYSKKYHGKLTDYFSDSSGQKQISYLVCFDNNRIRIILTKEKEREYYSHKLEPSKMLGVDVNIKNNIFACSDDTVIDLNRIKLKNFSKLLKRYDKKKSKCSSREETNKVIDKYSNRIKKWQRRYTAELNELGSNLVTQAISKGFNHIVMEDLSQMGRMFSKEEDTGIKYSRIARIIHLNSLNDIVSSICNKKGIRFSLVQASYTSQECICGYVDKDNRLTQESFVCLNCKHTENADIKSAKIIKRRVASDVHRNKLLKLNKFGQFVPKLGSYKQIKSILSDLFECSYKTATEVRVNE